MQARGSRRSVRSFASSLSFSGLGGWFHVGPELGAGSDWIHIGGQAQRFAQGIHLAHRLHVKRGGSLLTGDLFQGLGIWRAAATECGATYNKRRGGHPDPAMLQGMTQWLQRIDHELRQ